MATENVALNAISSNYSEVCEHTPLTNENILLITKSEKDMINGATLFALKYRSLPCVLTRRLDEDKQGTEKRKSLGVYHSTSILRFLVDEYKVDPNSFLYKRTYDTNNKISTMPTVYIDLNNHLAILFDSGYRSDLPKENPNGLKPDGEGNIFHYFFDVQIYHVPETAGQAEKLLEQICQFLLYHITKATLKMICRKTGVGFETTSIQMKKPKITDLNLHYGDEFALIHEGLRQILQEKDSTGITIFHGPPGTGKTNYLRYLINEIEDKELIYVPPDLVNDITKPDFLPVLMKYPNSILIIEDAENVVLNREQQGYLSKQGVSNLLNLSDGLLGDGIHQQIICTVNCDIRSIDPALLREGRLVLEYKFDKLSAGNARRLCVELGVPGNGEDIHEPTTLAEIYARKTPAQETSVNDDDVDSKAAKIKRLFKMRKQSSDTFLSFYS